MMTVRFQDFSTANADDYAAITPPPRTGNHSNLLLGLAHCYYSTPHSSMPVYPSITNPPEYNYAGGSRTPFIEAGYVNWSVYFVSEADYYYAQRLYLFYLQDPIPSTDTQRNVYTADDPAPPYSTTRYTRYYFLSLSNAMYNGFSTIDIDYPGTPASRVVNTNFGRFEGALYGICLSVATSASQIDLVPSTGHRFYPPSEYLTDQYRTLFFAKQNGSQYRAQESGVENNGFGSAIIARIESAAL